MGKNDSDVLSPPSIEKPFEDPWNILNIDLDALKSNYRHLRLKVPQEYPFFAVLKADAYGHGIREAAKVLSEAGCRHFAVESPQEAIRIRNQGIEDEVLLLNPIPDWMAEISVRHDLSVSVIHPSILDPLEKAARDMGKTCLVHLNVNVGLHRLGIAPSKLVSVARQVSSKPHLKLEALFGQPRTPETALKAFLKLKKNYELLREKQLQPDYFHFANSPTFLAHPETRNEGVRIGILLYGVLPMEQYKEGDSSIGVRPVMSLDSEIVQVRNLPEGSRIGYHSKNKLTRDLRVGVIPVGYYHGLNRKMTQNSYVLIRGQKAFFTSGISMNSSTVDLSGLPKAQIGDKVTLVGRQGDEEISVNDLAERSGTIGAEIMMSFGKSIIRTFTLAEKDHQTQGKLKQTKSKDIIIRYSQTIKELPAWISYHEIAAFLKTNLILHEKLEERILTTLDYALSSNPRGTGFVILATKEKNILGLVVCIRTDTAGFIPENIIAHLCVHKDHRNKGIGTRLLQEAISCAQGPMKVHIRKNNPAARFLEKFGFKKDYLEMRLNKGESEENV
ncbi:MAG: alanine racemase [Candidatus Aminicenantes bacterium]|nr:alanine racemase [Candidatus Aminicenantes bacterium]